MQLKPSVLFVALLALFIAPIGSLAAAGSIDYDRGLAAAQIYDCTYRTGANETSAYESGACDTSAYEASAYDIGSYGYKYTAYGYEYAAYRALGVLLS